MDTSNMSDKEIIAYVKDIRESISRLIAVIDILNIAEDDIEEFRETMQYQDTGYCVLCPNEAIYRDTLHIPWCEHHQFRGEFVDTMAKYDYPDLEYLQYKIAQGAYFTCVCALQAEDDTVALALVAIEMLTQSSIEVSA